MAPMGGDSVEKKVQLSVWHGRWSRKVAQAWAGEPASESVIAAVRRTDHSGGGP